LKLLITLLIISVICVSCTSAAKSPGQVVASENHFDNGVKQYEKGHIEQATHQFEKAIEKNPGNYKAYFYLGLCSKQQGAIKTANKHFQKAIDLNPDDEKWIIKVEAQMGTGGSKKDKKNEK